jgi:hypothetical protein
MYIEWLTYNDIAIFICLVFDYKEVVYSNPHELDLLISTYENNAEIKLLLEDLRTLNTIWNKYVALNYISNIPDELGINNFDTIINLVHSELSLLNIKQGELKLILFREQLDYQFDLFNKRKEFCISTYKIIGISVLFISIVMATAPVILDE